MAWFPPTFQKPKAHNRELLCLKKKTKRKINEGLIHPLLSETESTYPGTPWTRERRQTAEVKRRPQTPEAGRQLPFSPLLPRHEQPLRLLFDD